MYDISRFTLADMTECGAALRQVVDRSDSMEEAAELMVRFFYSEFRQPDSETSAFAMVRLFKSHPYEDLPLGLREFAASMLGHEPWLPQTKCLTLLATAGDRTEWNDRHKSKGHQAIPLPSEGIVDSIPMIARLVSQFGLRTRDIIDPESATLLDLEQKTYNVFYEPNAPSSKYITAQDEFVLREGIQSCLGFGGMLPSGNLFAVIMFSKVRITSDVASMFRTVALSAKLGLLPFESSVFRPESESVRARDDLTEFDSQAQQSKLAVLEQLIDAQGLSIVKQSERLERESREIYRAVFEQGNESILISNPEQDRIIDANARAEAMLGYSHEELLTTALSAIHPQDIDALQAFAKSVMAQGRGWTNQLRCDTKDGVSIHAEISASAVEISGQQCIIALVRDIGDRVAAEEAARELALVNERHRLARDLHDSVTQLIYSTTLFAEAGLSEAGAGRLDAVQENLSNLQSVSLQALKEMRFLLYQLSPSNLEDEGLAEALQRRLDLVEGRAGVDASCEAEIGLEIPKHVEESLFMVAQEALNNALKHSEATTVRVKLSRNGPESLLLAIEDNGSGFDLDSPPARSGMGLKNMESRVRELGGRLTVTSGDGRGTRILAVVPSYHGASPPALGVQLN